MKYVNEDFKHGNNLSVGKLVIIESDVIVGNNVKIGHRVTLKTGTRVGDNSIIDDHCITTGACYIGKNVNIRTGAIVSRATIVEDYCFIGPGVITNHTKNVTHGRESQVVGEELLTYISFGSIIGSQASLLAGLYIGPQSIIGGGAVVVKNLDGHGVYVGSPCKRISGLPQEYKIAEEPENAGKIYLKDGIVDHLEKYNKKLNITKFLNI